MTLEPLSEKNKIRRLLIVVLPQLFGVCAAKCSRQNVIFKLYKRFLSLLCYISNFLHGKKFADFLLLLKKTLSTSFKIICRTEFQLCVYWFVRIPERFVNLFITKMMSACFKSSFKRQFLSQKYRKRRMYLLSHFLYSRKLLVFFFSYHCEKSGIYAGEKLSKKKHTVPQERTNALSKQPYLLRLLLNSQLNPPSPNRKPQVNLTSLLNSFCSVCPQTQLLHSVNLCALKFWICFGFALFFKIFSVV